MELLSPAGNLETAVAAFQYGADAVYVGLKQFSARADAENFSFEDLEILMGLAHDDADHPRKVYVAVNTLLREEETSQLIPLLIRLRDLDVDALIVQDLATAHLVKTYFPDMNLHASTQMAVHNVAGMKQCREWGFDRVIAAREVTEEEIAAMAKVPGIELEVFAHGALCYAYSGLCLLSSVLHDHSGNRGDCSYVCRNCWKVEEDGRCLSQGCNLMSMKDLALTDTLGTLEELGVVSVKIEGRKKTPLYVAAVTNYYRHLLDGSFEPGEKRQCEQDIKTIFSRPWTRFCYNYEHATGVTDINETGPRGIQVGIIQDVVPGEPDRIRFQLMGQALEKHDGLQVELPGRDRPYGFPVDEIRQFPQGGSETYEVVFVAEDGATVEIPLPEDHPELMAGMQVFCTSSQAVKRRYEWPSVRAALTRTRHPIYFALNVEKERLTVIAQPSIGSRELPDVTTVMDLETPLKSSSRKSDEELEADARKAFAKLGNTAFELADFKVSNPESYFVPVSMLNELRRKSASDVETMLAKECDGEEEAILTKEAAWIAPRQENAPQRPSWIIKVDKIFALNLFTAEDLEEVSEVILDLGRLNDETMVEDVEFLAKKVGKAKIRLALPVIQRDTGRHAWYQPLRQLFINGYRKWQVSNVGALQYLSEVSVTTANTSITADWPLYVNNAAAARFLLERGIKRVTLAPDDPVDNTLALLKRLGASAEVLVFQDTPLAISAVCANASLNGHCAGKDECDFREMNITNRAGEELLVVNDNCQSIYLRKEPMQRAKLMTKFVSAGAEFLRADFCWRDWSPREIRRIWDELR
ncbi:MAG: U32 family peptidase [Lentisphaeria bacterium]|nr:U32 family peptidase [Lentisphaeria bacterium]